MNDDNVIVRCDLLRRAAWVIGALEWHIQQHNEEYKHVTPEKMLAEARAIMEELRRVVVS